MCLFAALPEKALMAKVMGAQSLHTLKEAVHCFIQSRMTENFFERLFRFNQKLCTKTRVCVTSHTVLFKTIKNDEQECGELLSIKRLPIDQN